jgi:hypothetical protein
MAVIETGGRTEGAGAAANIFGFGALLAATDFRCG